MHWIELILGAASGLILALGGSSIWFIREDKKAKKNQNEMLQSEEWKKLFIQSDEDSKKKTDTIERLLREKNKLIYLNGQLNLDNQALTFYKCITAGCPNRVPPREIDVKSDPSKKEDDKCLEK